MSHRSPSQIPHLEGALSFEDTFQVEFEPEPEPEPGAIDLDALRPHPLCAVLNSGGKLMRKARTGFDMTRREDQVSISRFGVRKRVVLDADDPQLVLDGWNTLQSYRRVVDTSRGVWLLKVYRSPAWRGRPSMVATA